MMKTNKIIKNAKRNRKEREEKDGALEVGFASQGGGLDLGGEKTGQ